MENIKDLRDHLIESFKQLKDGNIKAKDAKELSIIAGRIIGSSKLELDYNKYFKYDKKIEFLEVGKDTTKKTKKDKMPIGSIIKSKPGRPKKTK